MKQRYWIIGAIVLLVVVIISGVWLYDWVLGDTQKASEPISALPIELEPTTTSVEPTVAPVETKAMASPTPEMQPAATIEPVTLTQPAAGASEASEAAVGLSVYQIVPDEFAGALPYL